VSKRLEIANSFEIVEGIIQKDGTWLHFVGPVPEKNDSAASTRAAIFLREVKPCSYQDDSFAETGDSDGKGDWVMHVSATWGHTDGCANPPQLVETSNN